MISTFYQKYKVIILGLVFLFYSSSLFVGGIRIHQYYVGYQQNIERDVKESIKKGIEVYQREQAKGLLETQEILRNAKINTITEKLPVIIDRPIYLNTCADSDGIELLKDLKEKSNSIRSNRK